MKKKIATILCVICCFGLAACGSTETQAESQETVDDMAEEVLAEDSEAADEAQEEAAEQEETTAEEEEIQEEASFELTEAAQSQISAFVATAYLCYYFDSGEGASIFSMTPDECLYFVDYYIWFVSCGLRDGHESNAAALPFDWMDYKVTEQEVIDFFRYGLGIEIPAEYSFAIEYDYGSLKIVDGELQNGFDLMSCAVIAGEIEIVSQDENSVVLSGTCYSYDGVYETFSVNRY